jgi:hypothetical protein
MDARMLTKSLTGLDIREQGRILKSEDHENPEYDRALVEVIGYTLGFMTEELSEVADDLGIPWPVQASTTLLAYRDDAEPLDWEQQEGCTCDAGQAEKAMGQPVAHRLGCLLVLGTQT